MLDFVVRANELCKQLLGDPTLTKERFTITKLDKERATTNNAEQQMLKLIRTVFVLLQNLKKACSRKAASSIGIKAFFLKLYVIAFAE